MHVVMIAAENGAMKGGKVGGLGDVIRDVPKALAEQGHQVSVFNPGYGIFTENHRSEKVTNIGVTFAGQKHSVDLYRVKPINTHKNISYWVLEHPLFSIGGKGTIYYSDDDGPFATDAHKFALFCIAVCDILKNKVITSVDVIHCHDWHTSFVLVLRQFAERYQYLQKITTVYTIHNLAIQGLRPFRYDNSSLEAWTPWLRYDPSLIADRNFGHCINFMRAGINLADRVHTVSPTYAEEILIPNDPSIDFYGGEGLENDLLEVQKQGRLFGILNGCEYPVKTEKELDDNLLWQLIDKSIDTWAYKSSSNSFYFALRRLLQWKRKRPTSSPTIVSIGRLTEQKLGLLAEPLSRDNEEIVLDRLLLMLKKGRLIILGSGEAKYERLLIDKMAYHENLLFLNGYSEELSLALYQFGDLFLMPSTYEPCGISQMLAMRAGTPCLVHETGGLKDTVQHLQNGFTFSGGTKAIKIENFLNTFELALNSFLNDKKQWQKLCENAINSRFLWKDSIQSYLTKLYLADSSHQEKKKVSMKLV